MYNCNGSPHIKPTRVERPNAASICRTPNGQTLGADLALAIETFQTTTICHEWTHIVTTYHYLCSFGKRTNHSPEARNRTTLRWTVVFLKMFFLPFCSFYFVWKWNLLGPYRFVVCPRAMLRAGVFQWEDSVFGFRSVRRVSIVCRKCYEPLTFHSEAGRHEAGLSGGNSLCRGSNCNRNATRVGACRNSWLKIAHNSIDRSNRGGRNQITVDKFRLDTKEFLGSFLWNSRRKLKICSPKCTDMHIWSNKQAPVCGKQMRKDEFKCLTTFRQKALCIFLHNKTFGRWLLIYVLARPEISSKLFSDRNVRTKTKMDSLCGHHIANWQREQEHSAMGLFIQLQKSHTLPDPRNYKNTVVLQNSCSPSCNENHLIIKAMKKSSCTS